MSTPCKSLVSAASRWLGASLGWGLSREIGVRRRGGKNKTPKLPMEREAESGSEAAQLMGLPWRRGGEEEEKAENSPMPG